MVKGQVPLGKVKSRPRSAAKECFKQSKSEKYWTNRMTTGTRTTDAIWTELVAAGLDMSNATDMGVYDAAKARLRNLEDEYLEAIGQVRNNNLSAWTNGKVEWQSSLGRKVENSATTHADLKSVAGSNPAALTFQQVDHEINTNRLSRKFETYEW